jgi:leucine dehydrogenase
MKVFESVDFASHEQVVFAGDPSAGMRAVIAVHSTALGPAIGGCRIQPYETEAAALRDVLRLSLGMTLKAAVAGVPFGGAKMVVIADPRRDKTEALLSAIGTAIERLGGRYITGEDVGTTVEDMAIVRRSTANVMGLPEALGGSADPSPRTALGCLARIKAAVRHRLGKSNLGGVRVAVQGLGNVGWNLCKLLATEGAALTVSDVRGDLAERAARSFGAEVVSDPNMIYGAEADVFAPCALGAVINDTTEPLLKAKIVAGGANNQLADEARHGGRLKERAILYAPDYVINAGGMIQLALEKTGALDWKEVNGRVRAIGDTLTRIFEQTAEANITPSEAARRLARARLQSGAGEKIDAE